MNDYRKIKLGNPLFTLTFSLMVAQGALLLHATEIIFS